MMETSKNEPRHAFYYSMYWSQRWYRNTYLVQLPQEIGQALSGDQEWNSIHDSGCNFTCLAMIIGIDPAHLASELCRLKQPFFQPDKSVPALTLTGHRMGLVWDNNRPSSLYIPSIWHPSHRRRVSIKIKRVTAIAEITNLEDAKEVISSARDKSLHIVYGPSDHSLLIAGQIKKGDYLVWDPDGSDTAIEVMLAGKLTLQETFKEQKDQRFEFWLYKVEMGNPS